MLSLPVKVLGNQTCQQARHMVEEPHRMQNMWAVLRVMACSQKTCSGHCTTALLRMRFSAYVRCSVSSAEQWPSQRGLQ